jgi:glycosyltransferase involved in cell wall biosynthesis
MSLSPGRVVRVIARLNVGGPSRHVMVLDEGLRRHGWECSIVHGVVDRGEASLETIVSARGVALQPVPELGRRVRPWSDVIALGRVLLLLRRLQPDVVHTHTAKAGAVGRLAAAMYNATRSRRGRCLIVHTFHGHVLDGYFSPVGSWMIRIAERGLAHLADRIVTISPRQREDIVVRYAIASPAKTMVVPLGLPLEALLTPTPTAVARRTLELPLDAIVIAFIGRLTAIKEPVALVEAFAAVSEACASARLLIVGDGDLRPAVEAEVRRRGLVDRVSLAGWRYDLENVYGAVDIVALSSRNEGTPVALIEAMAAGRAVVATEVGGVPDLITHGENGLLVPPGDPRALADALIELSNQPTKRQQFGTAGRERVMARYGARRLVEDIHALYCQGLLEKRGSRGAEAGR